jgi:hypothetical protein
MAGACGSPGHRRRSRVGGVAGQEPSDRRLGSRKGRASALGKVPGGVVAGCWLRRHGRRCGWWCTGWRGWGSRGGEVQQPPGDGQRAQRHQDRKPGPPSAPLHPGRLLHRPPCAGGPTIMTATGSWSWAGSSSRHGRPRMAARGRWSRSWPRSLGRASGGRRRPRPGRRGAERPSLKFGMAGCCWLGVASAQPGYRCRILWECRLVCVLPGQS